MARTFKDPNPGISWLDEPGLKKQIARQAERALEVADMLRSAPRPSDEQIEREQFQFESSEYASQNPLYAAARGATQYLVLPLEPGGVKPLVPLEEATRDDRVLYEWWAQWPNANPGIRLGRVGGIWALEVADRAAQMRLWEMAKYEAYDEDTDRRWYEYREIGGVPIRFYVPTEPVPIRVRTGWGRQFTREVGKMIREENARHPETMALLFAYPSPFSGQDAFDYKDRKVAEGLTVMGEGDALPVNGAILTDGITVAGPHGYPYEAPLWLAAKFGKARSRKAMAAAREAFEAAQRQENAHVLANIAMRRHYEDQERERATADRQKAEAVLADEMAKG
jgi:hypothetical protein